MNFWANFLTTLSLVCGFISVIFSLEGHFTFASWSIIFSVIFDGLDGQVARLNPLPSEFGKQLDSLVDVVAFGIAPAILGYIFVYKDFYFLGVLALLIYLFCCVMRLAKYNITAKEVMDNCFIGLPTTASGGVLASFILIYRRYTQAPPPILFLLLVLILAILMVSKIKYLNLDGLMQLFRTSLIPALIVLLIILLALFIFYLTTSVLLPEIAILTILALYLVFSPLIAPKIV
jgi:CDP-diacylglycerol--serine O-phosphatidyltransferase